MSKVADIFESMEYGSAPESPDQAMEWIREHGGRFHHFIAGAWTPSTGEDRIESVNPASGKPLASVPQGTDADVDRAVEAAGEAFGSWSKLSGHARARYLYALARGLQKRARLFAVLETLDNGKPIRESRDLDIPLVARHFYHHAGWAQLIETEMPGYAARWGRRADHSLELPPADAGMEDRPGAGLREHRGPQAGRVHSSYGAPLRRAVSGRGPAPRRREHRHR